MLFDNVSGTLRRFLGALLLLPVAAVVWASPMSAGIVVALLAFIMAYEFSKMVAWPPGVRATIILLIALQALPLWLFDGGAWWHFSLAFMAAVTAMFFQTSVMALFGLVLCICLYCVALLLSQPDGHMLLIGGAAIIAACDSAAYFVGRFVGGPKLAPVISPNKTISGSLGGMVAAIIFTIILAPLFGLDAFTAAQVGFGVGVLSQCGDLFESAVKRAADIKDSGTIIPGHGGLLDRFDGYLFAIPGLYLILFVV